MEIKINIEMKMCLKLNSIIVRCGYIYMSVMGYFYVSFHDMEYKTDLNKSHVKTFLRTTCYMRRYSVMSLHIAV